MANYSNLKTAIENAVDWNNGDNEITGQNLLDILETIIDSLGAKYKFADVATPSSSITTPDEPLFYLAGAGTYTNFSGLSVTIPRGTLAIFHYDTAWHYTTVRTDSDAFFNVNQYLDAPSTTYTKANGRNAVPSDLRSKGMIITYLTTDGWIIEQNLSTSGTWNADANWQTVGPVSVSQNITTKSPFLNIGNAKFNFGWRLFYFIYGDNINFTNTSVYIPTLGIFTKDGTFWTNLVINQEFNLVYNENIVLSEDGTVSVKVSDAVVDSDVVLLTHSTINNDWIGGELFTQYLQKQYYISLDNDEKQGRIYTLTGVIYKWDSVSLESGKLWYFNRFTGSWGSTDSITQTYQFEAGTLPMQFLLYNTVSNSLSYTRDSSTITSNDIILLQFNPSKGEFEGGVLYPDYINSQVGNVENNTLIYSLTNVEYYDDHVSINGGKLWWVDLKTREWKSTDAITQDYYFYTTTTSFFVLDKDNNTLVIRDSINFIKQTDIILLQHTINDGVNGGILYPDYIKSIANSNKARISIIEDKFERNLLKSATTVVGNIYNVNGIYDNSYGSILLMPVTKGQSIILTTQTDKPMVYALLADNVLVNGERVNYAPGYDSNIITESNETVVVDITDGANYLFCLNVASNQVNYAPSSAVIKGVAMYGERVHLSEEYKKIFRDNIGVDNSTTSVINTSVILRQGGYDNNLDFISDDEYRVSTNPIRDGKLFETYDDYRIEKAVLLDSDLNVINPTNDLYLSRELSYAFPAYTDRKSWGTDNLLEGYYIVVSFVKADGSKISPNDTIIKNIYDIHSDELIPIITDVSQLENAIKRSNQVQNLVFKTKAALPVITDYSTASYKDIPADKTCVGMMYCSSKEYDKYVPTHVSYKTFMSALHNRRSLIYTEIIGGSHTRSSYGIPYHGVSCVTYYGINCNYNVFNVLGIIIPENTAEVPSIDGMQLIYDSASGTEFDIQNLRPLDIIDRSGHICIISNVYKDRFGKNVVVAFSEANVTWARTSLYTEETFLYRLHHGDYDHPVTNAYQIYRYSFPNNDAWENIYRRIASIKASYEEYLQNGVYNDDICTFAGDDAKFIEGDIIYLNINRGNYTQCQIYKDDTLLQTIDLSNDAEIDLNLTPYNLTDGSYKARLTDGVNYSDYTYWEVYDLELSINSSKVASFSSTRLEPLYFEFQSISGSFDYTLGRKLISDAEREAGEKTFTAAFSSSLYLKLFARTPDGYLITKRIVYNV